MDTPSLGTITELYELFKSRDSLRQGKYCLSNITKEMLGLYFKYMSYWMDLCSDLLFSCITGLTFYFFILFLLNIILYIELYIYESKLP